MKKIVRMLFLTGAIVLFLHVDSNAQRIEVRARMRPPVTFSRTRPPAPSPRHVWIGEEWAPRGTSYTWKGGYWALPPRPHAVWVGGHWNRTRRGYIWIAGHWG